MYFHEFCAWSVKSTKGMDITLEIIVLIYYTGENENGKAKKLVRQVIGSGVAGRFGKRKGNKVMQEK